VIVLQPRRVGGGKRAGELVYCNRSQFLYSSRGKHMPAIKAAGLSHSLSEPSWVLSARKNARSFAKPRKKKCERRSIILLLKS
jgi:hypothetical protein